MDQFISKSAPTFSEVHVDRPLQQMMVVYGNEIKTVSSALFSPVSCQFKSDKYFTIPRDYWFKAGAVERAPGTESQGVNYHVNADSNYLCKVYSVHYDLSDQEKSNYDAPLNANLMATRIVTRNLINTRELHFLQSYFQPGIWSGINAVGATTNTDFEPNVQGHGFWDLDTSDPIKDITGIKTYMAAKTGGLIPNKMLITQDVADALMNNKSVIDRFRFGGSNVGLDYGLLNEDILSRVFGMKVVISQTVLNTAQEGKALNMGYIASNGFLICYAPDAPSISDASAGYIFNWTGYAGATAMGNKMKVFRMENIESDRFEGSMCYDMKMVASDCGCFGKNVLSQAGNP